MIIMRYFSREHLLNFLLFYLISMKQKLVRMRSTRHCCGCYPSWRFFCSLFVVTKYCSHRCTLNETQPHTRLSFIHFNFLQGEYSNGINKKLMHIACELMNIVFSIWSLSTKNKKCVLVAVFSSFFFFCSSLIKLSTRHLYHISVLIIIFSSQVQ